jgi:uncharacterized membrane protein YfcA
VILVGLAKGGFAGIGILALPLLALVAPPVQAAAIMLPILMVQDVFSVWAFRRTWDRTILLVMLPGAAAGIALGYGLAAFVKPAMVELTVGVIAIAFSAYRLWADRRGPVELKTAGLPAWIDRTLGFCAGVLAGFTSQISHAGGPPFQIYVMPKRLARDIFIGTSSIFFAVVNWMKVPAYLALGQFTHESLLTSAVLLPLAIASTWAGVWLVRRVSGEKFYTVIYALLIVVGAKLVWDGVAGLL